MKPPIKDKIVRSVCRLSILAVLMLAIAGNAHAQKAIVVQPNIESLDVMLMNANSVLVGTLASRGTSEFTATVRETLKGVAIDRAQVRVAQDFNPAPYSPLYAKTTAGSSDLLLIAIRDNDIATVINLSKSDLTVMTADLRLLKKPDEVIAAAREILRSSASATEVMEIPVDARRVAGTKLENRNNEFPKNFVSLVVPADKRLETLAREETRSSNPVLRANGAAALRFFKSDANIAILKSLLDDPGWEELVNGLQQNKVRQRAYQSLKVLGVDVPIPILTRRLDPPR